MLDQIGMADSTIWPVRRSAQLRRHGHRSSGCKRAMIMMGGGQIGLRVKHTLFQWPAAEAALPLLRPTFATANCCPRWASSGRPSERASLALCKASPESPSKAVAPIDRRSEACRALFTSERARKGTNRCVCACNLSARHCGRARQLSLGGADKSARRLDNWPPARQ